jgi:hypothetical protein
MYGYYLINYTKANLRERFKGKNPSFDKQNNN